MSNDDLSRTDENDAAIQQSASAEDQSTGSKRSDQDDRQRIFDERFRLFTEAFGATCEAENVDIAVAIVYDPKLETPVIFTRGSTYSVARLLVGLLREVKSHIAAELEA